MKPILAALLKEYDVLIMEPVSDLVVADVKSHRPCGSALVALAHDSVTNVYSHRRTIIAQVFPSLATDRECYQEFPLGWRFRAIKPRIHSEVRDIALACSFGPSWVISQIVKIKNLETPIVDTGDLFDHYISTVPIDDFERHSLGGPISLQHEFRLGIAHHKVRLTFCLMDLFPQRLERHRCGDECSERGYPTTQSTQPAQYVAVIASGPSLPGNKVRQEPHHKYKRHESKPGRYRHAKSFVRHLEAPTSPGARTHDSITACKGEAA